MADPSSSTGPGAGGSGHKSNPSSSRSVNPPPALDPPFRGYIESTLDALLVFEAARRGMIPRVTRRLIERERGMVQSGAVFVFDEHESGIKRWTDGMVWSPSRILGNFLVYRETDKRQPSGSSATTPPSEPRDPRQLPSGYQVQDERGNILPISPNMQPMMQSAKPQLSAASVSGFAQPMRPRSSSEGYGPGQVERNKERSLVGSLTGSFKFKEGGLVKKTMSVNVNGFAQHMVSYYSVEDVVANRLRTPSSLPELLALDISPEYLQKQNFRFPPIIEVGQDGIPRYAGEPEETTTSAAQALASNQQHHGMMTSPNMETHPLTPGSTRPSTSGSAMSPVTPGDYGAMGGPGYFETQQMQHLGHTPNQPSLTQMSTQIMQPPPPSATGMVRQTSEGGSRDRRSSLAIKGSYRYDPYGYTPPNTAPVYSSNAMSSSLPSTHDANTVMSGHNRRLSDSHATRPVMGHPSPPSPMRPGTAGPSSSRSAGGYPGAGYSGGDGLERVPEIPSSFPANMTPSYASNPVSAQSTSPQQANFGAWPPHEPSYMRSNHGLGFKNGPTNPTMSADQQRYASLGSTGLPPILQAADQRSSISSNYPRSISEGGGTIYGAVPEQPNLVVYQGEPSYQNNNGAWGRKSIGGAGEIGLMEPILPTMNETSQQQPHGEYYGNPTTYERY